MNKEDNLTAGEDRVRDEEPPQEPEINKEPTDEIVSSAEPIPEAEQLQTTNHKLQIEQDMEVHHHSHESHGKKNWKAYFWEFLMLFLAVFCGFLAEYQLEHVIEHQREEKYAESLLEDLKKDTIDLAEDIPFWDNYIKRIDTLRNEIKKPSSERDLFLLYRCVLKMRYYDNFNYNDRTIQQLKNGGNFRLIRKKLIADSLIDYDSMIQSQLRDQEIQSNNIWQNVNFLQDRLFSSDFFQFRHNEMASDSAIRANPEIIKIRTGKEDDLFEYYNRLQYFQVMNTFRIGTSKNLLHKATNLIEMIKKEYHLE
jgi:hypothetical protein